jgi:hypothetical protein
MRHSRIDFQLIGKRVTSVEQLRVQLKKSAKDILFDNQKTNHFADELYCKYSFKNLKRDISSTINLYGR